MTSSLIDLVKRRSMIKLIYILVANLYSLVNLFTVSIFHAIIFN